MIAPLPAPVIGDAGRLQQVVTNLVLNAIKFTPEGGRVMVRLAAVDSEAVLAVADTGRGIAPAFLPYVFQRFTQSETRGTRDDGLGLGLFIVHHLVAEHGGTVTCESPGGETSGATFTVRLPLARERVVPQARKPAATDAVAPLAGIRVLLVEDDEDTRAALELALAGSGAEVFAAGSAREALALFDHATPGVVVSDLAMPGEDGYWLVKRLRATTRGRTMPIVALTGFAGRGDAERAIEAGFTVHVAKPADPERLVRIVAGLVGRLRPADARHAPA
jgi:CheY-like chemotaxis protein